MSCLCTGEISPGNSSRKVDQELLDAGSRMWLLFSFIYHNFIQEIIRKKDVLNKKTTDVNQNISGKVPKLLKYLTND